MTEVAPAIGFSVNYQIDERRGIVAQTHVPQDAEPKAINSVLDRIFDAVERRATIIKLADWRLKLADDEKRLGRLEEDYRRIGETHASAWAASGKKGAFKLDQRQEGEKRNAESTIDRYKQEIELDKQRIEECEAKLKSDDA